jgi:hypothetical protein
LKWDLKNKKTMFFTLDEMEDKKEGVLLLDSFLFQIIPLSLSKGIDERERELEIEEKLDELIDEYDSFYYIDKEITIYEDEDIEKTLIIMIEKDKIYSLIDRVKESGIKLLGVYPLFFMEFFNLDGEERNYIEIDEERSRVYTFSKNRLIDFQELEMERDEILAEPKYLEEYLKVGYKNFIYPDKEELKEQITNLEVIDWHNYNYHLNREYDYLPEEYHSELSYKKQLKGATILLSLVIILGGIFFFLLQFFIDREIEKLNSLQESYQELKEKNIAMGVEIEELEKEIVKVREENRERGFNGLKLSQLLLPFFKNSSSIEITKLEYDGVGTINIEGSSFLEEDIYSFQNSILTNRYFKRLNQDFIKFENGKYQIDMDIEVEYDKN